MSEVAQLVLRWLKALCSFLRGASNELREWANRTRGPLRLHAILASNRLELMAKNLSEALRYAGVEVDEAQLEELEEDVGLIIADSYRRFRELLDIMLQIPQSEEELDLRSIAPRLKELTDTISLTIELLRTFSLMLEKSDDIRHRAVSIVLQGIIDDLDIIRRRHQVLLEITQKRSELSWIRKLT